MMALLNQSLALHPSFAQAWFVSGHLRVMAGHCEAAIEHIETSLRLSPGVRMGSHWGVMGMAYFFLRRFEPAAEKLLVAIQEFPAGPVAYRFLAAAYAHMGRLDEARAIVDRLRFLTPLLVPSTNYIRNPEHRELVLSGLRLAAGEPA
jgi:adenylate cyclase